MPLDLKPVGEPQLLELEVLPAKLDLVGDGHELAVVAHQDAKEVGHVEERRLGPLRVGAHERQHRIDAVEQEMRADPGLQRLQARLGDRGRQRLRAKTEIEEQHAVDAKREQEVPHRSETARPGTAGR